MLKLEEDLLESAYLDVKEDFISNSSLNLSDNDNDMLDINVNIDELEEDLFLYEEDDIEMDNSNNSNEENLYLSPEEKNELAEKDDKLVQYMAKKFMNTGIPEDELIGIAYEGYVKALNMYKKNKKTKFSTYACKCMGNEILCFLRKEKKWSEHVTSMHAPIGVDKNGNALDLEKILKEDSGKELDEMVISKDIDALVISSLKVLNDTEKKIMVYRFGLGGAEEKTQKTIAQELGISQAYVSKLEKDCLDKIKKYIQEEDLKNGVLGKNSYYNY